MRLGGQEASAKERVVRLKRIKTRRDLCVAQVLKLVVLACAIVNDVSTVYISYTLKLLIVNSVPSPSDHFALLVFPHSRRKF